jgi:hypothetical protein
MNMPGLVMTKIRRFPALIHTGYKKIFAGD